jgi:hypothetical protein
LPGGVLAKARFLGDDPPAASESWRRKVRVSRLDSYIRRLEAQRSCLDATRRLLAGVPGPILELGLGSGRTYDHLRQLHPEREIFVFERLPAPGSPTLADRDRLIVGDLRETLPAALAWLPSPAALVHNDTGTGDPARNERFAAWLARALPACVRAGGIVLSDQRLDDPALVGEPLPDGLPDGRYFLYRQLV